LQQVSQSPRRELELLEAMIGAVLEAGRAAYELYHAGFDVHRKADESPVTAADHAAEAIILRHLAQAAPSVPVIAEEQVAAGRVPAIGPEFFLVDHLDGTREFIQKRGDFTVNIALVRGGLPVLGVVHAPAKSVLYTGDVAAKSAFRSTTGTNADEKSPREALLVRPVPSRGLTAVVSRSHDTPETETYLAGYPIADRVSVGSSLKFCLVAAGEADLYPRLGPTMEWDTAAGQAVLIAAGGTVVAPGGGPLRYGKPGFRNSFFVASGSFEPVPLTA
jgi:3'(2'), 5'-bisphosphate nucleotidase